MSNPNPINKDTSGLDEVFDTVEETAAKVVPETNKLHLKKTGNDVDKDYEYTRGNLYSLIDKGQEAVYGALDLAMSSDHPRAYEVAGQLIKTVSEVSQNLLDLQDKLKKVKEIPEIYIPLLFIAFLRLNSKKNDLKKGLVKSLSTISRMFHIWCQALS